MTDGKKKKRTKRAGAGPKRKTTRRKASVMRTEGDGTPRETITSLPQSKNAKGRTAEFLKTLEKARGKKLLIAIKGYPDPDNISCSMALQWIALKYDIQSTIVHFEKISHHENRALVKKLDVDLEEFSSALDLDEYDYLAINDSQSDQLPVELPDHIETLVFVDHHKSLGTIESIFLDIREDAGSNASIYCEYLKNPTLAFGGETQIETKIATALMHGIRSDTDNFTNAMPIDYKASEFLAEHVDRDLLSLISRQSIPGKTMDMMQVALQRKDIRGNFMFAGVGYVREEDRDGIGQCADYMLHREGIDTVVMYGIVGNSYVDGSLRTSSHIVDPDKWLKEVFGKDEMDRFYGGGRKDKGGFQIPLGVFAKCSDKELLWILIKKTIDELFYEKIGVEEAPALDD